MIKVIKQGTRQVTECPNCGCIFSFEEEDIKVDSMRCTDPISSKTNFVDCPQCNKEVVIASTK